MVYSLAVASSATAQADWEILAEKLFSTGPVGIMEEVDGTHTIFAKVVGYVHDPVYGRLIQIERVDGQGKAETEERSAQGDRIESNQNGHFS